MQLSRRDINLKIFFNGRSFQRFVKFLYRPTDPSSLGVIRFLFGLLMLIDLCEERGGADIDLRWGDPRDCHFPLFPLLHPLGFPHMALLYGIMWLGACGIMLGCKFTISTILFAIPYWFILLLDKSFWNNHSYLYGIIAILLTGSSANHYLSIDGLFDKSKNNSHVPYWNYFILKYQFFMLYFLAGLKKTDTEWLEGYSVNLGAHWVFFPFKLFLRTDQIDYLVIHWFGFLLDLTIGFWMLLELTRPIAMLFCACFHLMNSRLFSIGMFPYVCLATMPLFCQENWPRKLESFFMKANFDVRVRPSSECVYTKEHAKELKDLALQTSLTWKHKFVGALLLTHCGLQAFLPYSHFITKGFNNWTNGLYGYSWDMMVHSWDTILVVVKVVDNNSGNKYYLDPEAWSLNDRWNKHADMCLQYANCLKNNLINDLNNSSYEKKLATEITPKYLTSENISIYIDVWCSLNGRFQQRMYNPNYDLLKARWSPFDSVEWLLPVLSEYNDFRSKMAKISNEVYSWSNFSNVLFVADFPGLYLENYITEDLANVTLTILDGEVFYEVENEDLGQSFGKKLKKGENYPIEVGIFHKIHTVSKTPSSYMYTYVNTTKKYFGDATPTVDNVGVTYSPFPLIEDVSIRIDSFVRMMGHIYNSVLHIFLGKPLVIRKKLPIS